MIANDLLQSHREEILRLSHRYKATNVRVFGSFARGEETEASDVDFLVHFEPGASLLDQIGLKHDLEDLLGRKVDVVSDRSVSRYIRAQVLEAALPL